MFTHVNLLFLALPSLPCLGPRWGALVTPGKIQKHSALRVSAAHTESGAMIPSAPPRSRYEKGGIAGLSVQCVYTWHVDPLKDPVDLPVQAFSVTVFASHNRYRERWFHSSRSTLQMNPSNSDPICWQETQHGVQPVLCLCVFALHFIPLTPVPARAEPSKPPLGF